MKERTIKFIWDYYGKPAAKTAEHHKIHLQEFAEHKKLKLRDTGFEKINAKHSISYILLKENEALEFKDVLKPNKAYIIKE